MKKARMTKPRYEYTLPEDADRVRVEALAMGNMGAIRDYPVPQTRDTLETRARAALVTLRTPHFTNDFAALCTLYIPYYIAGYEDWIGRYHKDEQGYQKDKTILAEIGPLQALSIQQEMYWKHLTSIKQDMQRQMGVS